MRVQPTTPAQVGFVGAAQIGWLQSSVSEKGKQRTKEWVLMTSASAEQCNQLQLLLSKRLYWRIESGHQQLDVSLDEDRSRTRSLKALTVLGMFRRMVLSFANVWLTAKRKKAKRTTRDFQHHLAAHNRRLVFHLITSIKPMAWNAK